MNKPVMTMDTRIISALAQLLALEETMSKLSTHCKTQAVQMNYEPLANVYLEMSQQYENIGDAIHDTTETLAGRKFDKVTNENTTRSDVEDSQEPR